MKLYLYLILLSTISLVSCQEKEKYPTGFFTEEISNLKDANSFYDDFNMDLPMIMYRHTPEFRNNLLVFSSNRPGGMGGFDLYQTGTSLEIN